MRVILLCLCASIQCHNVNSLRHSEKGAETTTEVNELAVKAAAKEAQQHHLAPRKTAALFYGDSILRYATSDFCASTSSDLWESLADIKQEKLAGPRICSVRNSDTLLLDFFSFGFGYELPLAGAYEFARHPQLPANSKETLKLIKSKITKLGINIDAFFLQSNLWDVSRHDTLFGQFSSSHVWEKYSSEWKSNATEMIQLVEELFPKAKHSWISTCVSERDTRKTRSESLNEAARAILPESWSYLDVRTLLHQPPTYRDKFHLAPNSTIPLMRSLLEVLPDPKLSHLNFNVTAAESVPPAER